MVFCQFQFVSPATGQNLPCWQEIQWLHYYVHYVDWMFHKGSHWFAALSPHQYATCWFSLASTSIADRLSIILSTFAVYMVLGKTKHLTWQNGTKTQETSPSQIARTSIFSGSRYQDICWSSWPFPSRAFFGVMQFDNRQNANWYPEIKFVS